MFACSQSVSRQYSAPLRSGHKTAHMFTETTTYNYVQDLAAPKRWFTANVDRILELYGAEHDIQKEDLFLGTYMCFQKCLVLCADQKLNSHW